MYCCRFRKARIRVEAAAPPPSSASPAVDAGFDLSPPSMFHLLAHRLHSAHVSGALQQLQPFFSPEQQQEQLMQAGGGGGTPAWKDPMYTVALK